LAAYGRRAPPGSPERVSLPPPCRSSRSVVSSKGRASPVRGMRSRARTAVQTPRVAGVSTDLSPPAAGCPAPALPPDQSGADPGREFLAVARDLVPRDDRLHPRGRPLPNRAVHARFPGAKPHGSVLPDTGHQEGQSVSSRVSLKLALQRECLAVADRSEPGGSAPGDPARRCLQRLGLDPLPCCQRTLGSSSEVFLSQLVKVLGTRGFSPVPLSGVSPDRGRLSNCLVKGPPLGLFSAPVSYHRVLRVSTPVFQGVFLGRSATAGVVIPQPSGV